MTGPAVGYLIRIELRRRGWSLLVLGILVALVVGTVLASLAGARRSGSAFDRYLDGYRGPEAAAFGEPGARAALADLEAIDQAIDFELISAFPLAETDAFYPLLIAEGGVIPFEVVATSSRRAAGRIPAAMVLRTE